MPSTSSLEITCTLLAPVAPSKIPSQVPRDIEKQGMRNDYR